MTYCRKLVFVFCVVSMILGSILLGLNLAFNKTSAYTDAEITPEVPKEKEFPLITPSFSMNDSSTSKPPSPSPPTTPPTTRPPPTTTPTTPGWTTIAVSPQTMNLTASDSFTIEIDVINVTDLVAYAFALEYNNTVVTATEVNIGDFFPKDSFVIRKEISTRVPGRQDIPTVWVAVQSPLGSRFRASGNGTLATVGFKAISTGSCVLKLCCTQLVKDDGKNINDIAHNVIDGYVECKMYEHEIAAYLGAPIHLQPGSPWLINGSAVNKGLSNETDVIFQLLIDGEVVNFRIASLLTAGSSIDLTYMFTPTEERTYNVTAYVKPVPNEEHTQNNAASTNIVVRTQIRVPQDYETIQEAINAAVSGETIVVASGVYHEHIGIDKPLTLVGENCNTTIIEGDGETKVIVIIKASQVTLSGFTIRNGSGGILLDHSNNSVIAGNIVVNTMDGLSLLFSHNNTIISNRIKDNEMGLFLGESNGNTVYHNSFINNTEQAVTMDSCNTWDNGTEGNYWSDYKGEDSNSDGIGDTPHVIDKDNRDNYPLMNMRA